MTAIDHAKIGILATHGFEKSELFEPKRQLAEAGAEIHIISLEKGEIASWDSDNWGEKVAVDKTIDEVSVTDYDALVLPGGQINPDLLRVEQKVVNFVKEFYGTGKPLAAICHAPWLLIEADVIRGRRATSYKSIKTDMMNAGARWEDATVVCDKALITSRNPGDLDEFCKKIVEEVRKGRHDRKAA